MGGQRVAQRDDVVEGQRAVLEVLVRVLCVEGVPLQPVEHHLHRPAAEVPPAVQHRSQLPADEERAEIGVAEDLVEAEGDEVGRFVRVAQV